MKEGAVLPAHARALLSYAGIHATEPEFAGAFGTVATAWATRLQDDFSATPASRPNLVASALLSELIDLCVQSGNNDALKQLTAVPVTSADLRWLLTVLHYAEPAIAADEALIPEMAERPVSAPRMPSIEDFPAPAQAEFRAHQAEQRGEPAGQQRRPGLFERITSGLTRREDDGLDGIGEMEQHEPAAPQAAAPVHASEYAKRPRPAQHESQVAHAPRRMVAGSAASQPHADADDEYEIPAFLRRQSN